jgi:membrane protease YdiL (CAAX protease family)
MTAIALDPPGRLARPALILAGLAAVVGLRSEATVRGVAGAVEIGLVFGLGLLVVAFVGGWRPTLGRRSSVAVEVSVPSTVVVGAAGGAVLVALAIATRSAQMPWLAPASAFVPWVVVTILVASAEEVILRGILFDELDRTIGTLGAVLVTSVVFALMHVPLYGWHVVPLDLGVGLWLAGLRLATGRIAAPAIAHAIADLATWWL